MESYLDLRPGLHQASAGNAETLMRQGGFQD